MTSEQKWDLVQYRLANAKKTLREVDLLIQNRLWNIAVNRLYYACFYAVTALLLNNEIKDTLITLIFKVILLRYILIP